MTKVASFGDINVDVVVTVPELPAVGGDTFAEGSHLGLGGSATNTAFVLTRLGIDSMVVAQVGGDSFGDFARTELKGAGIDISRVEVSPTHTTGLTLVSVTAGGERTMVAARGANPGFDGQSGWLEDLDWLHVSGYAFLADPQRGAARVAIRQAALGRTPVSVDIPAGVADALGPALLEDLAGVRLVSVGVPALRSVAGEQEREDRLLAMGVEMVAVTAGAARCRLVDGDGEVGLDPPTVPTVDSTGAGDSFVAGLVGAGLAGLDREAALVAASTLGAAATTHPGAGAALGEPMAVETAFRTGPWIGVQPGSLQRAERFLGLGRQSR